MICTVSRLQRDYGLSFVTASSIIHEQTELARRHYRTWFTLGGIGLAIVLAGAFALSRPFASTAFHVALSCACLCAGIGELLTRRCAQAPILAAARAASADSTRSS